MIYVTMKKKKRGDNMSDDRKIEVINGNGEDLEISQVYDHLDIEKPNTEKKKEIVIPKAKKKEEEKKDEDIKDTESDEEE